MDVHKQVDGLEECFGEGPSVLLGGLPSTLAGEDVIQVDEVFREVALPRLEGGDVRNGDTEHAPGEGTGIGFLDQSMDDPNAVQLVSVDRGADAQDRTRLRASKQDEGDLDGVSE